MSRTIRNLLRLSFIAVVIFESPLTAQSSLTASSYHVFPQFADGRLADGSYYRTTLMISNPIANGSATCALQPHGLTLSGFNLDHTIIPGGWIIATTSGSQTFQSGYATLQCSASVEAQLLYSLYQADGIKAAEATVFSSQQASTVIIPVDQRGGAKLALAIANDSDRGDAYIIRAFNVDGSANGFPCHLTVGAKASAARFLRQLDFGVNCEDVQVGYITIQSITGTAISAIGFRFTGSVFTTIPASWARAVSPTATSDHIFPQFADGRYSDGSFYRTSRMYTDSEFNLTADCQTQLRGLATDGSSTFIETLVPGRAVISATRGTQPLQAGYATMRCRAQGGTFPIRVDAFALYSYYGPDGTKRSEATVFSSPQASRLQILADTREGARVGVAIANDSDQINIYTIVAQDSRGALFGPKTISLSPRTSVAAFLDELIPLPKDFYGVLILSSTTGTGCLIGFRFTGTVFTTIPGTIR